MLITQSEARFRNLRIPLAASAAYLIGVVLRDIFITPSIRPNTITPSAILRFVSTYEIAATAVLLPALAIIAYGLQRNGLREAVRLDNRSSLLQAAVLAVVVSVVMDRLGLWPYSWRIPTNSAPLVIASLWLHGQWLILLLLAIRVVVLTALLEEVTFRLAFLQFGLRRTSSPLFTVVVTSLLFGSLHTVHYLIQPDKVALLNVFWLTVFAAMLATFVLRRDGNISVAIAAHATRNLVEFVTLCIAISRTAA
jgi:membrane protease YdiL (CAAX protease family)